jgi:hypothetical protein
MSAGTPAFVSSASFVTVPFAVASGGVVVVWGFEVKAKAWTAASADVASSLEASLLYLFSRPFWICR